MNEFIYVVNEKKYPYYINKNNILYITTNCADKPIIVFNNGDKILIENMDFYELIKEIIDGTES